MLPIPPGYTFAAALPQNADIVYFMNGRAITGTSSLEQDFEVVNGAKAIAFAGPAPFSPGQSYG